MVDSAKSEARTKQQKQGEEEKQLAMDRNMRTGERERHVQWMMVGGGRAGG